MPRKKKTTMPTNASSSTATSATKSNLSPAAHYRGIYSGLLSTERLRTSTDPKRAQDRDLEAFSDKGRIVRSAPFRRLQNKAQVFSMARTGSVRTRLTHSIEVANYGELIAETLAQRLIQCGHLPAELRLPFIQTVENACLLHDIGNPPFGHMGEYAIQQWFKKNKRKLVNRWVALKKITGDEAERHVDAYTNFDGNPQGFRIITRLQWFSDSYGMNLTCSLLAAYLKYLRAEPAKGPFRKKIGYFPTEVALVKDVWKRLGLATDKGGLPTQRHPLTFLMEASDDIAYCLSDIEDAVEKSVVTEQQFISWMETKGSSQMQRAKDRANEIEMKATDQGEKSPLSRYGRYHLFRLTLSNYLVECAVDAYEQNEDQILNGSMEKSLLSTNSEAVRLLDLQKEFCTTYIYTSREAISTEIGGLSAITGLLDEYRSIIFLSTEEFDQLRDEHNKNRLHDFPVDCLLLSLLPPKHMQVYDWHRNSDPKLEPIFRAQLIVDYVSGMTDSHVLKIYNMIKGTEQLGIE